MTKEQMIDRYEELYHKMKTSKDVKNMKAFGDAMTWTFGSLYPKSIAMLKAWSE